MPKYSVKKSFTILVAVILVLGVVSLLRIQTDLLPSMSPPYLLVMTTYPGASPEQVEADVTQPLADAIIHGGPFANIADAAGIGKGTVYEYFSSKEEILQGLGHYCFEQENARVAERFDRCRTLVDLENELVARLQAAGEIDPGLTMDACRTSIFCTVTGGLIALCCSAGSGTSLPALPALPQNLREELHRSLQAPK